MKSSSSYDDLDIFLQKQDKCLQNTDHTTGNAYQKFENDLHQNSNFLQLGFNLYQDCNADYQHDSNVCVDIQNDQLCPQHLQANQQQCQYPIQQIVDATSIQTPKPLALSQEQRQIEKKGKNSKITEQSEYAQNNIELTLDNYKLSKRWKQKIDNNVLQQKSIGQFSAKHNRNMAKFFVRLFIKYAKNTSLQKQTALEITQRLQQIAQKKCISLKDLQQVFGGQSSARRQFMAKILNTRLTQEIIKSQDIKNKYAYLLCSKVYSLRCRSRYLVGRLQSR